MPETLNIRQYKTSSEAQTRLIGAQGERLAARFLEKNNFRLVMSNFKAPVGRNSRGAQVTGEIDLIAYEAAVLCFVEVKTRSSDEFASPLAAVDLRKQRQIVRTARVYRRIFGLEKAPVRFDVVSIVLAEKSRPKIELFRGYFAESRFRKTAWADKF